MQNSTPDACVSDETSPRLEWHLPKPLVMARSHRRGGNPVGIFKRTGLEDGAARRFYDWIAALRSQRRGRRECAVALT